MTPLEIISPAAPPSGARARHRRHRFTIDGSDALEERLARVCERVAEGVTGIVSAARLDAILLAGGYGRGEGGVLKGADGDRPYNDMEFYVFLQGNRLLNERRFGPALHELGHRLSGEAAVEVELKVLSFEKLRASPRSMFYYDMVMGHRWVVGHEALLSGAEHHRHAADIPLHEATRLLMNRCSGLLFAQQLLQAQCWSLESADFVRRNVAKAQLALGDAVLSASGQYHWSCRKRNSRLHDLTTDAPDLKALREYHDEGVTFKLHPFKAEDSRESLRFRHEEVVSRACAVFLWIENQRLQGRFADAQTYGMSGMNKCPETNPLRNFLINARAFGAGAAGLNITRHPRERLLNALALLLWTAGLDEPRVKARLQEVLRTNADDFSGCVKAYRELWRRFN